MKDDLAKHGRGAATMSRRGVINAGAAGIAGAALSGVGAQASASEKLGTIDQRLEVLGIVLPDAPAAVATYAPCRIAGDMVYLAGQGPDLGAGSAVLGKLGRDRTIEEGVLAARLTAINLMAQAKAACDGDLDRIIQWVRLSGFVNSADDFTDQPKVVNGASDLLVEVFGEKGLHARAAVGVNALPFNIAVEIEAIFQIRI